MTAPVKLIMATAGADTAPPSDPGKLYTWGTSNDGKLGNEMATSSVSTPVQVGALTTWTDFIAGNVCNFARKNDGTLWSWGENTSGALGHGTGSAAKVSSPTQIGSLTNWTSKLDGLSHISAIKSDGTLWAWGESGLNGGIGDGTIIYRSSPVQIGALTTWESVAVGNGRTHAIKTDGTLWAWGKNTFGGLGLEDAVKRSSPVQMGALTNWAKVTAAGNWGGAIKDDGTLWMWGYNGRGELGQGNTINTSSPVQVGSLTDWSHFVTNNGIGTVVAFKADGTVWSWGYNNTGNLAQGDVINRSSPTQIGSKTTWSFGAVASDLFLISTTGKMYSVGQNTAGVGGRGDRINRVIEAKAKSLDISQDILQKDFESMVSLRTFIEKEDIANMAVFLLSDEANKISGQILTVDGNTERMNQ